MPKFQCKPVTEQRSDEANELMSVGRGGWLEPANRRSAVASTNSCSGPMLDCCVDGPALSCAVTTGGKPEVGMKSPATWGCQRRQVWGRAPPQVEESMATTASAAVETTVVGGGVVGEGEVSSVGERKKISHYPNLIRRRRQLELTASVC
jgi:hypothetical protein